MRRGIASAVVSLILVGTAMPCFALSSDELAMVAPAAERGSDASQVLLAIAYLNGDGGLARDPARAAYWFERAAMQGNAYAEKRLGDLYAQGLGVPANPKLVFDWTFKAANRGETEAQVKVGKMYQEGAGVGKDMDQAIYWFSRAATEGSAEAQYLLGKMYHNGEGVEPNPDLARSWLEKAAQRGYESAVGLLHLIESIGYHLEEEWYHRQPGLHKLAEDGDMEAQYQLAQRYEQGVGGLKKNTEAALLWYGRAAASGHPMAKKALEALLAQRKPTE